MDKDFTIGCKDKSLKILEVQKEGKTKLLMRDLLRGMSFNIGDLLN